MTCDEARELMLTAEMEELGASGDGALAMHIRSCDACAHAARSIVLALRDVDAALDGLSAPVARGGNRRLTRARMLAVAAVLAGVAIGGVSLQREMARRAGDAYPLYLPSRPATAGVVNAEQGSAVALIRTSNPKITVVWYLKTPRGKS